MKKQSTRERYRDALRAAILDAAREAFARDGYEALSMRGLAEQVGCTHGNIYLHFKNKEALFDSLVAESFAQFHDGLRRIAEADKGGDSVRLLKEAGRAYVDFGLRNRSAYEFAFVLRRPGRPRSRKPDASYLLLRSMVKRCIDQKRFRSINADVAAQALWAAVHGITSLLLFRPSFPWAEREAVIRRVIDSAVDGLLREP